MSEHWLLHATDQWLILPVKLRRKKKERKGKRVPASRMNDYPEAHAASLAELGLGPSS